MPSASAKLEKQTSTEAYDPVKQVLTIVEKKVRNLEKRKGKLDSYRQDSANGKELNEDQKKAVEKYDQVVEVLEFTKELQKQFQTVIQDCSKAQRKAAKREQLERQQIELQRIKEVLTYQDLLTSMGGEDIRNDFLNGNSGAVKLTEEELNSLDELYKAICPERDSEKENSEFDEALSAAADHIQALLDSKNKEIFGTTYKALKETLLKIQSCSYFGKKESEEIAEEEPDTSLPEEKDNETDFSETQYASQAEDVTNEVEESTLPTQRGLPSQAERPYYQMESSSLYTEQSPPIQPIQEVLSVQGNLNFLQESQIELESSHTNNSQVPTAPVVPTYPNVQFSTASQSMSPANMVGHCTRRPSGDASNMSTNPAANNLVLANSASLQQQVGSSIPASVPLAQTTQALDFDPARPIPTQTYTNQSFSTAIHPMMAAAVSQNYVPVVTMSHTLPPPHVLTQNMAVQPLPPRSTVSTSLPSNPNLPMAPAHTPVSGLSNASALTQQASNIYSLCLKMNQLGTENSQPTCVPSSQYDCNDMQENDMIKNSNSTFVNARAAPRESRPKAANNAYPGNANQVGYGNEQAYQSTNNSQGYVNRDSFTDNSSYSSNLKRGLNSRGGTRGNNTARGTTNARGSRGGYRN